MKRFLIPLFLSSLLFSMQSEGTEASNPKKGRAPESPFLLSLGSPDSTFRVIFNALVMQSFANNGDYGAEALPFNYGDDQPAVSPSWVIPEIAPDFHFGFDLGLVGVFHEASSALMLNWERYHSSNDSDSMTVNNINNMIGPFFEIGPDASTYKQAKGSIHFHFDQVNLDYGTFVHFGNRMETNWFAGVGFARLLQHRFSKFSNLSGTVVRTLDIPAKFTGAGPQLGMNFNYKIVQGLRFVGKGIATLFVGNFTNSTTFETYANDLVLLGDQSPNLQTTTVDDKMGITTGLESKLGFAYEFASCSRYWFRIEAGYQAQVYLDAIRSIDMGSEVTLGSAGAVGSSTVGVYARTFDRTVSNFGLAGPYATLDFGF